MSKCFLAAVFVILLFTSYVNSLTICVNPVLWTNTLSGKVVFNGDQCGKGMENVELRLYSYENRQKGKMIDRAVTDINGHFRFDVKEGVFLLESRSQGFAQAEFLIHYNRKYRPGSSDIIFVLLEISGMNNCASAILAEE